MHLKQLGSELLRAQIIRGQHVPENRPVCNLGKRVLVPILAGVIRMAHFGITFCSTALFFPRMSELRWVRLAKPRHPEMA